MANDRKKTLELQNQPLESKDIDKLTRFFSILIEIDQRERKKNARSNNN